MSDVTRILNAIERGDAGATDELLPLVYEELRVLAAQKLSHEPPGQTLQATALVHEAYMKLVGLENQNWRSKGHFFVAAAEAMRRILIDHARHKKSLKHGGSHERVPLDEGVKYQDTERLSDDLVDLDEALEKLSQRDRAKADLVKLRYFAGLTSAQAAAALGISHATAERYWDYASSWLRLEIQTRRTGIRPSGGTTRSVLGSRRCRPLDVWVDHWLRRINSCRTCDDSQSRRSTPLKLTISYGILRLWLASVQPGLKHGRLWRISERRR